MKKIILSIVTIATIGFANAQSKEKGSVEITPKIGFSGFSEQNGKNSTNSNSGVELGATVDYYFNNRWSLRSGITADKMGGSYANNNNQLLEDKLNYLSIPVNANWHFGSTRKWNLNFGFSPSFLSSAKTVTPVAEYNLSSSDIKSFQLGLTYGIGYKIEITKKFGLLLDAQFFDGLTNINNFSSDIIKNTGYSYNLGGVIQL